MQTSYYPEKIMRYLNEMPNSGVLPVDSQTVYCLQEEDDIKGYKIKLFLDIENDTIRDFKYLVYGDGFFVATLGRISEIFCGLSVKQAANYNFNELYESLEIPANKRLDLKVIPKMINSIILKYKIKR
jgi:NifU-like protein involved in Fe-S cluster formation